MTTKITYVSDKMTNTKYLFKCNDCPAQEYTDTKIKICRFCGSVDCDNILLKGDSDEN